MDRASDEIENDNDDDDDGNDVVVVMSNILNRHLENRNVRFHRGSSLLPGFGRTHDCQHSHQIEFVFLPRWENFQIEASIN